MIEEDAAGLLAIAEKHRQPALQIEVADRAAPPIHNLADSGWVELAGVRLDAATAASLRLPAAVEVKVRVSADWLREPVPAPPHQTHRVEIRPSPATHTGVAFLGAAAHAHLTWSVPFAADLARAGVPLDEDDRDTLDDALLSRSADQPTHQFLGFADALQDDVWESAAQDLTLCGEVDRLALLRSAEHRLLFQIDSDPGNDFMIGDLGRLYVLIPSDDLVQLRGDRALAVVQMS
jgi:uncharacterized protein DUF1963